MTNPSHTKMGQPIQYLEESHYIRDVDAGVFDQQGFLWIERHGVLKKHVCQKFEDKYCGDWCLELGGGVKRLGYYGEPISPLLKMCEAKNLRFGKFTDQRPHPDLILQEKSLWAKIASFFRVKYARYLNR